MSDDAPEIVHIPTMARFRWPHRWTVVLVMIAVGMAALAYVAAANYVPVDLRLPGWQEHVRLSWVVLGSAAIGIVIGVVTARLLR